MTDAEMKHTDISRDKMYLVNYDGIWLLGSFHMEIWGWSFDPNLGVISPQVNDLSAIYEVEGLPQKKDGSTFGFITGYLKESEESNREEEDDEWEYAPDD
jgi:hypothetical protein